MGSVIDLGVYFRNDPITFMSLPNNNKKTK